MIFGRAQYTVEIWFAGKDISLFDIVNSFIREYSMEVGEICDSDSMSPKGAN